jgi:hypothetical protein
VQACIANHQDQLAGVLSGFDRLVVRGTLRSIAHAAGRNQYRWSHQMLPKQVGSHVEHVSQRPTAAALAEATALGRPVRSLASPEASAEDLARGMCCQGRRHQRPGVCADLGRTLPHVRDLR